MFSMILEDQFNELDDAELVAVNGGTCTSPKYNFNPPIILNKNDDNPPASTTTPTVTQPKLNAFQKMIKSIGENFDKKYIHTGNTNTDYRCDNWTEEVLQDAGFDINTYYAGDARTYNCEEHIENLKKNGEYIMNTPNETESGVYIVLMNDGHTVNGKKLAAHTGILVVGDGNPYFVDNSSGNSNHGVERTYGDKTVTSVMSQYGYDSFYYQKVK